MPRCEITLTANAGCAVRLGRSLIFIDALHDRKVEGYSTVTPERWVALRAMYPAGPDAIVFTHSHFDHFSPKLTARALEAWPGAKVVLPEDRVPGQRLLSARRETLSLPGVRVLFARLPHEGEQYRDVAHYGCILESDGFRVLFPGDCALCAPELRQFVEDMGPIDAAVVDFPWVTLRRGREFVEQVIRPKHLLVNHLPFEEDDVNGYRAAAVRWAREVQAPDVRLLLSPFQREVIN